VAIIMMDWFDEEEILRSYIASEIKEATEAATKEVNELVAKKAKERKIEIAKKLIMKNKMSINDIAEVTDLTEETVRNLEKEVMQGA
jgi:transcription initiation factor TFIIIB Brf1 subunit/transcription initiation factor TFIIB